MNRLYFWIFATKMYLVKEPKRDDVQLFSKTLNPKLASLFTANESDEIIEVSKTCGRSIYKEVTPNE